MAPAYGWNAESCNRWESALSLLDDIDPTVLVNRLAAPLAPDARRGFRSAAEEALMRVSCAGEGAFYRAVAPLQRSFFDPPSDERAGWDVTQSGRSGGRPSRLKSAPALEHGGDQRHVRYRRHQVVG
jgi:hypothetical protein